MRRAFVAPGIPKMIIWGPYGSGKTQTLFYLEWVLHNDHPSSLQLQPHTVHLDIEVQSKSDASSLHLQLLEMLGKETVSIWVRELFKQVPDLKDILNQLTADPNVATSLEHLRTFRSQCLRVAGRLCFAGSLQGTAPQYHQRHQRVCHPGLG